MQSCSCTEFPANNFMGKCYSPLNYNDYGYCSQVLDTLDQFPVHRGKLHNYVYYPKNGEKNGTAAVISSAKKAIILQKKYHAFRRIWDCNKFASQYDRSISSKYWPPPILPVRGGLKIPVEYVNETPVDPWSTCQQQATSLVTQQQQQQQPPGESYEIAGEDETGDLEYPNNNDDDEGYQLHRIRAQPQDEIRAEESEEKVQKRESSLSPGILNTHESEQFRVEPASVIFLGSQVGKLYEKIINVKNKGQTPRRLAVINPQNSCFDVIWGAGLHQTTLLAPGLCHKIIVRFSPPKSGQAVHDMVTIIIDEDGAIVIPIIAESSSPILQMEEWDMGCSTLGNPRMSQFEIINRGEGARFWILSQEEFNNEYLELRGPRIDTPSKVEDQMEQASRRRDAREKMLTKADHLEVEPFKLHPACFHLQKNQHIVIQIVYRPTEAKLHMRKVAILCDNGEIRWTIIKGIGIDPNKSPLVSAIVGKCTAPPVDLPTDLNTRITLDCGDLLAGEVHEECFKLKNNSCMPLYFFWSVRTIRFKSTDLLDGPGIHSDGQLLQFQPEGLKSAQWRDYEEEGEINHFLPHYLLKPIKIYPSHGILRGNQVIQCRFSVQAPAKQGYHSAVLSVFVQQLDEQFEQILTSLIGKSENFDDNDNVPIPYESLIRTLPPKQNNLKNHDRKIKKDGKNYNNDENDTTTVRASNSIEVFKTGDDKSVEKEEEKDVKKMSKNDHQSSTETKSSVGRGPCKKSTDQTWSLGPMFCPIICLERKNDEPKSNLLKQNDTVQTIIKSGSGDSIMNNEKSKVIKNIYEEAKTLLVPPSSSSPQSPGTRQAKIISTDHYNHNEAAAVNHHYDSKKSKLPRTPLFYVQRKGKATDSDEEEELELTLEKLEKNPKTHFDNNEEEEEEMEMYKYEDYFGEICQEIDQKYSNESENIFYGGNNNSSAENEEENGYPLLTAETQNEEEEETGENFDEEQIKLDYHKRKLENLQRRLSIENCVLQHRFNEAKKWLDDSSPLQPTEEIEIWAHTVPLQCWFDPPQVTALGQHSHKILRTVEFINHTAHPVHLSVDPLIISEGMIVCRPYELTVEPFDGALLHLTFDFRRHGDHTGKISASLKLPFPNTKRIPCWLPFRIMTQGPSIQVLSPMVNFGLVLEGTEHVKTIPVKNTGTLRTKWTAKISDHSLMNDDHHHLTLTSHVINKLNLVRPWPTWGTIDPGDTIGIQIYLSAHSDSKLSCTCELIFDDDPSTTIHLTIVADIQRPSAILDKCRLILSQVFVNVPNFSVKTVLRNLSIFPTPFKWLADPMGKQSDLCTISVHPQSGVLPAKGSIECQFQFLSPHSLIFDNLFVLCCIGGLKEPLVVKLEGTVFSLCLKIVIPKTRLYRIREEDLALSCRADLWPSKICGQQEQKINEFDGETADELPRHRQFFVDYLGIYGKYCLVKQYETQAPPPSVSGFPEEETARKIVAEEEEDEEEAEEEEKEEEEEEEEEESEKNVVKENDDKNSLKTPKGKKGKKTKNKKNDQVPPETKVKDSSSPKHKKKGTKVKKGGKKKILDDDNNSQDKMEKAIEEQNEPEIEQNEEEDEEDTFIPSSDKNREKSPFFQMMPEDFDPSMMTSEGKLIYFQIRQTNQVATVKFSVHNEAPISTVFAFKVTQHPVILDVHSDHDDDLVVNQLNDDEKPTQFIKLDDQTFRHLQQFQTTGQQQEPQERAKDLLNGQKGGVFHIFPSQGILKEFHSVDITIEFHANSPGIYEDTLECYFEGLDKPYIIKLEALATMCDECIEMNQSQENIYPMPESPSEETNGPICRRKLNPLLY